MLALIFIAATAGCDHGDDQASHARSSAPLTETTAPATVSLLEGMAPNETGDEVGSPLPTRSVILSRGFTPSPSGSPLPTIDVHPASFTIPWGAGPGQAGWLPPISESRTQGPYSLAVDADGTFWVLDQVNLRVVRLDPMGRRLGSFEIPAGACDLVVGPSGRLHVFSLVNRRVWVFEEGALVEEIETPLAMPHISRVDVDAAGGVILVNHTQHSFYLGLPGARIGWPDILHTRTMGIGGASGGPTTSAVLHQGMAALVRESDDPREPNIIPLADTLDAASVILLDTEPDGSAVVVLEWFEDEGVSRTLRRVDGHGRLLHEKTLPPASLAFPFREFVARPMGPIHQILATPEGLSVNTYSLGRTQ